MNNIAVIGLGSMGYGIASSCLRSGHSVWGVDTNNKLMTKFCDLGGQKSHLDDSILDIDVVVVVVLNSIQTKSVLFNDSGIVKKLKPGSVVIYVQLLLQILQKKWNCDVKNLECFIWMLQFLGDL